MSRSWTFPEVHREINGKSGWLGKGPAQGVEKGEECNCNCSLTQDIARGLEIIWGGNQRRGVMSGRRYQARKGQV